MRVVMVSKACVVGEYQKKLEELATFPGLALTVIVPPFWRDERGVLPLERAYTNGYTLRVEPLAFNGQFHLHFYPTLARVFRELQPDLVHLDEEPYNLATWLAQRDARRASARSLFFTWQNLLRRYPLPFEWMQTRVFKQTDYAIAGSDQAARVLRAKNYRGPLSVLPQFGVNPEKFLPAQVAAKSFRIGFVGRLVEEKGLAVLLRALASLRGDWELRVLGRGPESEKLQTLTRELNIQNKISFDRPRPSTEMPTFYQQLDVLVVPSRTRANWQEQFGRVLIEAMACGVAVIGSNCGEIPNVIGDAGIVVPENDPAALLAALEILRDARARRAELGARGRARVLKYFTHQRIAAETYAIYQKILSR